ncbi:MAG: mechanosensitive ion channel family protein [Chloroflexota bacterium]|nr:mechanosensitive ion channel family protein [Chloroflexota bacterium]
MDWRPVLAWLGSHGVRILIILAIGIAAYYALHKLVPTALRHGVKVRPRLTRRVTKKDQEEVEKRIQTLSRIIVGTGTVITVVVVIFMILSEVGIDVTPLLAGLGIVGVALGFGAQSLVKDVLAGVFILLENQYRVGDVARVADVTGVVEEINLRRTVLRDLDGIVHFVPNGEIKVASNYTRGWSRANLNISVAYGTDLDQAIAVINRVGAEMVKEPYWKSVILKAPEVLRVDKLGDSGIDIKILGDTKPIRQWEVMGELRKRVKKAFDEEGIEIPWPHTKLYFGNAMPDEVTREVTAVGPEVSTEAPSRARTRAKPPPPVPDDDGD